MIETFSIDDFKNFKDQIKGTCSINELREDHLSYCNNKKFFRFIQPNKNAIVIISKNLISDIEEVPGNKYLVSDNPTRDFLSIHNEINKEKITISNYILGFDEKLNKVSENAIIHPSVVLGDNVSIFSNVIIHPNVVIGDNVVIGENTEILPSVTIYSDVTVGKNCIIDAGATIGGDGFRIINNYNKKPERMIHTGGVLIGNYVEIGNNSVIDRGTFDNTVINDYVKIDNLVHVGHNVQIGENTLLAASSCIGGSTVIGKNVWIGIGATLSNGIQIVDETKILINAVVAASIRKADSYAGMYAIPNSSWLLKMKDLFKNYVNIKKKTRE